MESISTSIALPEPYHLGRTLRLLSMGHTDRSLKLSDGRVQICFATPSGDVAFQGIVEESILQVELFGDGGQWMVERLPDFFGLNDDPSRFCPAGPAKKLVDQMSGAHLPTLPVIFHRLLQIVLQQLVSWKDATLAWRDIVDTYGTPAPGPWDLRIGPTSDCLRTLGYYDLVDCGVLPRQARTILRLAREESRIERLAQDKDKGRLVRFLHSLPGIGEWTVQYLLGTALGDADAVLTGDYGLPHSVAYLLEGKPRSNDEEMVALLEPFRGNRFRLVHLIQQGAVHAPRYGARRPTNRRVFGIGRR